MYRWLVATALVGVVAGCSGSDLPPKGVVDYVQGYFGGLAADEPQAALVARDVLSAGGNAADAAVAMYFALSVTLPSSAGLGGGGVCVVHGSGKKGAEAIDFSARPPAAGTVSGGRWPVAVPGAVRGMFALQARYGTLQWQNLLRQAERMARFGVPVSRALARQLAGGAERLRVDPESWRIFSDGHGQALGEGQMLQQLDLAAILGRIRMQGAGDFYNGEAARKIVDGVRAAGGELSVEELRSYHPRWIPVLTGESGNHTIFFPGKPIAGGVIAHALWSALNNGKRYNSADGPERQRVLAQAAAGVYRDVDLRIADDFGTTGFAVMDRKGGAVACSLSMYGMFGTGRMIRGTGMLAAPPPGRNDSAAMAPMVMVNVHTGDAFMAAAASASAGAPLMLVSAVLAARQEGVSVEKALETVRVRPGTRDRTVLVESGASDAVKSALAGAGLKVEQAGAMGLVNMIYCSDGMTRDPELCEVRADRRGSGYAINAEF